MLQNYKLASIVAFITAVLLPIFFVPAGILSLDVSKTLFLTCGVVISAIIFLFNIWKRKEITIPYSPFIITIILFPLIYLVSALFNKQTLSSSLFGYNLEVGTFGYMLTVTSLLLLIGFMFTDTKKAFKLLLGIFASFSIIMLFAAVKIFSGGQPILGLFFGSIDTPIGKWTDLAVLLGLMPILSILLLIIVPINKYFRIVLHLIFWLSLVLLTIINFSPAFIFVIVTSVLLLIYLYIIERKLSGHLHSVIRLSLLPLILIVVSAIFLINPKVPFKEVTLGELMVNKFQIVNTEVRPSLQATLDVSKAVLSKDIFFGSGPNTFSHDWLIYKPAVVNTTPFWGVAFPMGVGFIPTQVALTGVVGALLWVTFFMMLILLMIKLLNKLPESRVARFTLMASMVSAIYLWLASFMYLPSVSILTTAYIFLGVIIGLGQELEVIKSRHFKLLGHWGIKFASTILLGLLTVGFGLLGFTSLNKTLASYHFNKALTLSNTTDIDLKQVEEELNQAIKFAPADIHYQALSKLYFHIAQLATTNNSNTSETNQKIFQEAISKNIEAANKGVAINPSGYQNWLALGSIYGALVPAPLSVEGAYENAKIAYDEAYKRNPLNPEIALLKARLEFNNGDIEVARSLIRESIALKTDYVDAYLMLAQLEKQSNNIREAIKSAERVVLLIPDNPNLYFELGLLKYSDRDYLGASESFSKALKIESDYANAQYYLGLSYIQLNQLTNARQLFEQLAKTNPNNAEINNILERLREGKNPL